LTEEIPIWRIKYHPKNLDEKDRINFIKAEEKEIFGKLDMYFNNTWEIARNFTEEEYDFHQKYSRRMLWPLLRDPVETNRLVCEKPLGYAGDFIIMNYIYDFHNKYLGSSSYEKLINFYTCNIPISTSVVKRKDFFKKKILEVLGSRRFPNVLSVGSGPTRELLELVREAKIVKPLYFDCLDFEKKALEYIQTELQKIESENKLVFIVNRKSNKKQIKWATEKAFNVKVVNVKILIDRKGRKKAWIKLSKEYPATEIATRLGML